MPNHKEDVEKTSPIDQVERLAEEDINSIMSKFDRESAFRILTGHRNLIIAGILILFSVIQLFSTWWIIPSTHMRPLHLAFVMGLAYLLYPARRKSRKDTLPWYDVALAVVSVAVCLYPVVFFQKIVSQNSVEMYELIIGGIGIVLLFEACRRVVGLPIVVIALVFVAIGFFGRSMPGFLGNRGFSLKNKIGRAHV